MIIKHMLRDATLAFCGKQPLKITVHDSLASLTIAQTCYMLAQHKKREKVIYS